MTSQSITTKRTLNVKHYYTGVTSWTATNKTFPRGLESFNEKVQLPIVAHNRYWSSENVYAKQNGGQYDFVVEEERSIPIEQKFWNDLIENSTKWGLTVYEQDWLHNEWYVREKLYDAPFFNENHF